VFLNYVFANLLVVIQMISKKQLVVLAILASVVIITAPVSVIFGQVQATPTEQLVAVTDKAEQQVNDLIDWIYSNETALGKIEEAGLLETLDENITLYDKGKLKLVAAHDALDAKDYDSAVQYATDALGVFREVFSSIHIILEGAGLQKCDLIDYQGLFDTMARYLGRIDRLREILPEDTPDEILRLLDEAEALLDIDSFRTLLSEGKTTEVRDTLLKAQDLIVQVQDYLKEEAEGLNAWRIEGYCERVQERIRERIMNGNQAGIDFTDVLESFGYQSESQFMEELENMINTAKGKTNDFQGAMQDLAEIGHMVQEMDQAMMEKMNMHMNGFGVGNGEGSGNIGGNYMQGGDGNGAGGNGQ
jgi:hypothetical protein